MTYWVFKTELARHGRRAVEEKLLAGLPGDICGAQALNAAKVKVRELFGELFEDDEQ